MQGIFKENVRDPIFSDSRDPMIIFSDSGDPIVNSRDPNRVPKTPYKKPCAMYVSLRRYDHFVKVIKNGRGKLKNGLVRK